MTSLGAIVQGITGIVGSVQRMAFVGGSMSAQWRMSHPGVTPPEAAGHPSVEKAYEAIDRDLHRAKSESLAALDIVISPGAVSTEEQILSGLRMRMMSAAGSPN